MREIFVADLVKEILGPRNGATGIRELLDRSPLDEFITGVLEPVGTSEQPDPDSTMSLPTSNVDGGRHYEGDSDDSEIDLSTLLSPSLDPKKRASTMGISFFVKADDSIDLDVCVTWARYLSSETTVNTWQRNPRYAIIHSKLDPKLEKYDRTIDYLGKEIKIPEIKIRFLIRQQDESGLYFVSIFLINLLRRQEGIRDFNPFCIFQPQIRINTKGNTKIVSSFKKNFKTPEEEKMNFLYKKQSVLARGHLVSAVWSEIDPENTSNKDTLDYPESIDDPPFKWIDGEQIDENTRKKFQLPEIRTDFVPLYLIPSPKIKWTDDKSKKSPELMAKELSEMWKPEQLKEALMPLYHGYKTWIENLEKLIENTDKEISKKILNDCKVVRDRILLGINLLCDTNNPNFDQDATLAFCFANKSISLQAEWKNFPFEYRPFQLGFLLMCIESIVNKKSTYRDVCDLMWVPTGTGKTEAYLALAVFTFAYRRRMALKSTDERTGAGISVLTRYTLRLLTIQQFRRTVSLITASEYLRITKNPYNDKMGWRPNGYPENSDLIWGSTPFSVGLWIGSAVTPNNFIDSKKRKGAKALLEHPGTGDGAEPAQILECPACGKNGILAISSRGLEAETSHKIHFTVECSDGKQLHDFCKSINNKRVGGLNIQEVIHNTLNSSEYHTITLKISSRNLIKIQNISEVWICFQKLLEEKGITVEDTFAHPSRPGYFFNHYLKNNGEPKKFDFEIFCPNPECKLKIPWCGGAPFGKIHNIKPSDANLIFTENGITLPDGNSFVNIIEPFQNGSRYFSDRVPITGFTIDVQTYRRVPTIIIATSDKFARPPFEPNTASIFGNVNFHHNIHGYYRLDATGEHPSPAGGRNHPDNWMNVTPLRVPDFVLQDELHLIDGPLGSMAGIYESAVDFLCSSENPIKYIASTATIRRADDHVQSLFNRRLQIFPPHGLTIDDRFFIKTEKISNLQDEHPGRLYLGICSVGRGPLTPLIRIWSRLAQTAWERRTDQLQSLEKKLDPFWTITGYFNAVRELAGATALYRQDIKDRLITLFPSPRPLDDDHSHELSGRTPSTDLPAILDLLEKKYASQNNDSTDSLFTTSMFGTGVDISRLGLMIVNGQPKTTSSYIQSTGRVGRGRGALVVTFYRGSRPRDLNHYEFFSRHHMQIQRFVESPTVYPFASSLMDRALGPIGVYILRNMRNPATVWASRTSPPLMANLQGGYGNIEVDNLKTIMQNRERNQPKSRKSKNTKLVQNRMSSAIETWQSVASTHQDLVYTEYKEPTEQLNSVVLGDPVHENDETVTVTYRNAPQSLRELEEETTFQT